MAFFQKKQRLIHKGANVHFPALRQRMVFGYGEKERLTKKLTTDNVRIFDRQAGHGNIEIAGLELLDEAQRGVFHQVQVNVRELAAEVADMRSDPVRKNGGNHADAE